MRNWEIIEGARLFEVLFSSWNDENVDVDDYDGDGSGGGNGGSGGSGGSVGSGATSMKKNLLCFIFQLKIDVSVRSCGRQLKCLQ